MDTLATERGLDLQATWVIDVPIHGFLYNQAPADAQSTGAGIKCLYYMSRLPDFFSLLVHVSINT